jgi:1-pyrroline-5-carboxylate dehydrogenase
MTTASPESPEPAESPESPEAYEAPFRLTYATMFDPPPELHRHFDDALQRARREFGAAFPAGWPAARSTTGGARPPDLEVRSPINRNWLLARFCQASRSDVDGAVRAACNVWPAWAATPWQERVRLLRRAATLIEQRVYDLSAVVALEVGKNRMESIGEVQETADLINWYCDQMEQNRGFDRRLPNDPLAGFVSRNRTVLKPYGAWAVIAPFNFPFALAGAPVAAALLAGNTVVFKVASETAWSGWLLMQAFADAGIPDDVLCYLTGSGSEVGEAMVRHPAIAGATFTGSHAVGMGILRHFSAGAYPRPCIAEMGGKNAVIVSRHADLNRAAIGIVRSAFGLQGQKCSACSRVYVEKSIAGDLRERLVAATRDIRIGDPTERENWMGPVISAAARARYLDAVAHLRERGRVDVGGEPLTGAGLDEGHFVAPTVAGIDFDDPLWKSELFAPLVLVGEVDSVDEGITRANRSNYGLTAGFYGAPEEIDQFLQRIEAGVTYVNRPQGATTGAWPGYQPFGGWKASGTTGKAIGSFWYLPLYLREQSQTIVD